MASRGKSGSPPAKGGPQRRTSPTKTASKRATQTQRASGPTRSGSKPRAGTRKDTRPLLYSGSDWTFDTLRRTYEAIEDIALNDLGLDIYPNQIEVISSEQMLDAYSSTGMPLMYRHWSFGKTFLREERQYKKGLRGLAYEIVINSNPVISYNMEENTMPMQTLVMAHAAFGHNHFFKNNHLFRMWTEADSILDYLEYARNFVSECEERHGERAVEQILDAAHALMPNGIFRYERPAALSLAEEQARHRERLAQEEADVNYLWQSLDAVQGTARDARTVDKHKSSMNLPEENLLYFIEQYSPILETWQRELLRIVRNVAQYFYPQRQTKVMNEGCACFVHYHVIHELHRRGQITDGALFEMLHSHTNVITQPDFDDPRFSGINPYALGFAITQDIRRICEDPTDEDREWFPMFAGRKDWRSFLKEVWANFRDESFIQQFLSPKVIRQFRMFAIADTEEASHYTVTDIQDARGVRGVRDVLARNHDLSVMDPDIQVVDVDLLGDRSLHLVCHSQHGARLDEADRDRVLAHVRRLWGFDVTLEEEASDQPLKVA